MKTTLHPKSPLYRVSVLELLQVLILDLVDVPGAQ